MQANGRAIDPDIRRDMVGQSCRKRRTRISKPISKGTAMGIVETKNLVFEYIRRDEEGNVEGITRAVDQVDIDVKQGEFVAVLGHNGSGKSTLAKHINAILYPTEGTVWVDGKDTAKEENLWDVRQKAGMVFQHPANQIIGQVVEEDEGFGDRKSVV